MASTDRFAYPAAALAADYARASAGLAFGAVALLVPMHWILTLAAAAAAFVLLGFGARTALRQASRIVLREDGIAVDGPLARTIPWDALDRLSLRYYSTRRDRKRGWMELKLRGGGRRLTVESQIEGFDRIAAAAARVAAARGVALDSSTRANLSSLGIELD
jgi:hypothetical protein